MESAIADERRPKGVACSNCVQYGVMEKPAKLIINIITNSESRIAENEVADTKTRLARLFHWKALSRLLVL